MASERRHLPAERIALGGMRAQILNQYALLAKTTNAAQRHRPMRQSPEHPSSISDRQTDSKTGPCPEPNDEVESLYAPSGGQIARELRGSSGTTSAAAVTSTSRGVRPPTQKSFSSASVSIQLPRSRLFGLLSALTSLFVRDEHARNSLSTQIDCPCSQHRPSRSTRTPECGAGASCVRSGSVPSRTRRLPHAVRSPSVWSAPPRRTSNDTRESEPRSRLHTSQAP